MPTYEYACSSCEHHFEHFQSITANPLRTCPSCGRKTLKRLIGAGGGIIFKGSGFYQTDYRSESYRKAAEAEKQSAAPAKDRADQNSGGDKPAAGDKATAGDKPATASPSPGTADNAAAKPNAKSGPARSDRAAKRGSKAS
jgi:putative FmdB family regulatory protein